MTATAGSSLRQHTTSGQEFTFMRYQEDQKQHIHPELAVESDAFWSYCGPLLNPSSSSPDASSCLPVNFHEFAAASIKGSMLSSLLPFLEFVHGYLTSSHVHHYFLTIRATTSSHGFDQPRWHTDDMFFASKRGINTSATRKGLKSHLGNHLGSTRVSNGTNWKICTTLLGPSTLFIPREHQATARKRQCVAQKAASTDHTCLSIRCVGCAASADRVREELAKDLAGFKAEMADPGECTLFRLGKEAGAVHSEPCTSKHESGRIFVNVVPGTEEELRSLVGKWGMEFPRQWWVGSRRQ